MSPDRGVEPGLSARGTRRRGGSSPTHRLAAVAAGALGFSDASIALLRDTTRHVLAATHSGGGLARSTVAALDQQVLDSHDVVVAVDPRRTAADGDAAEIERGTYLGVPLTDPAGQLTGVLSVHCTSAIAVGSAQVDLLADLGQVVSDQLDLLRRVITLDAGQDRATTDLARAVGSGEIIPFYQPLIDLTTGEVKGMEALARWRKPSGEFVQPAEFIPLAERSDMIVQVDRAVMRRALGDLARWQRRFPQLRLSINLSGRHVDQADWVEVVRQAADRSEVAPETVDLELTETVRPTRTEHGKAMLREVRTLGFKVWFDDFGTGWSALQDLILMPVDGIKIDRSFTNGLGTAADDAIVRALTSTAAELGLRVTIEGVETPFQAVRAKELGCHFGQGYLWSPPVSAERLEAMMPASGPWRLPTSQEA